MNAAAKTHPLQSIINDVNRLIGDQAELEIEKAGPKFGPKFDDQS
jgi:hypothetical protein